MQIPHFQSDIAQIIGQIFRRPLGQCCHQNSLTLFYALTAELNGLIDLILQRFKRNFGIEKTSRTDDLLDDQRRTRCVHIKFFRRFIST